MCDYCDKSIYFDTSWYHSDAGYGDDDYGGVTQNLLSGLLICPVCGKVKEGAIKKYGSKEEVLRIVLHNNYDRADMDKYLKSLDTIFTTDSEEFIKDFLVQNKLVLEDNKLKCSCGHLILEDDNLRDINSVVTLSHLLESNSSKYCPDCGQRRVPAKMRVNAEKVEGYSFELESKRTWGRS